MVNALLADLEGAVDIEIDRMDAVFRRAIAEPSRGLPDIAAKARLLLDDLLDGGNHEPEGDDERLTAVVLREITALCA